MSGFLFELEGIRFNYGNGQQVFRGLDFTLEPGERVGLTGATGSGKSTLLRILTGLVTPQAGTIKAFGMPRRSERDFKEVRRRAGLLFQDADDQLFCPTVREEVAFGPRNLGMTATEAHALARSKLEALGLDGYEDRITYRLSGGEKRLVALAAVLAMEPDILLLDEPTSGLDPEAEARLTEILRELPHAMILVSHDRAFLDRLVDRTVKIEAGRIMEVPSA